MKLLVKFCVTLRALLIASIAGSPALSQQSGFADQEEADWAQARSEGTADAFQRYSSAIRSAATQRKRSAAASMARSASPTRPGASRR